MSPYILYCHSEWYTKPLTNKSSFQTNPLKKKKESNKKKYTVKKNTKEHKKDLGQILGKKKINKWMKYKYTKKKILKTRLEKPISTEGIQYITCKRSILTLEDPSGGSGKSQRMTSIPQGLSGERSS